jgi:hypothetical protein
MWTAMLMLMLMSVVGLRRETREKRSDEFEARTMTMYKKQKMCE